MSGELREQIVEALNTATIRPVEGDNDRHDGHFYSGACHVCRGDVEHLADAVLKVVSPLFPPLAPRRTRGPDGPATNSSVADDLAAWLLEQITEDERAAQAVKPLGHSFDMGGARQDDVFTHGRLTFASEDGRSRREDGHEQQHFQRWDPARVLAECDAKRRIVELEICTACAVENQPCDHRDQTLHLLALPYSDRPGYREEWRPKS